MRRKIRLPLVLATVVVAPAPDASRADLLISEMCDPRVNYTTDRFLEIHNAGATPVDLTDWSLVAVGNGVDIFTWNLSGTIAPGEALVAGDATTVESFPVDFAAEAWSDNNGTWNGKVGDGAKLLDPSAAVVDHAVVDATRFENKDYARKYTVTSPNPVFDPAEWTALAVDYATQGTPGAHSTEPPVPSPTIASVTLVPAAPLVGDSVDIRAIVTDSVAVVTSVSLSWGSSPSSLPNGIPMSVLFGNVWETDTPIPGQAAGVTIYYRVEAANDLSGSTSTIVRSYTLPVTVSVQDVQGAAPSSPYEGDPVVTSGVVTAAFGDLAVVANGSGPWHGVWVTPASALSRGDSVTVRGDVVESRAAGFDGTTMLTGLLVLDSVPGSVPPPSAVPTGSVSVEDYEGVLVLLEDALCTSDDVGSGWAANDGSGTCVIGRLGYAAAPTPGSVYRITGIGRDTNTGYQIEPRDAADVVWIADPTAPSLVHVTAGGATQVVVTFSEHVEEATAETPGNYSIPGVTVDGAERDGTDLAQVLLWVTGMAEGPHVLSVSGVEDLHGNVTAGAVHPFEYVDYSAPSGYYDAAAGLRGEPLRAALHGVIDGHLPQSYDFAWTAYYTTDDKPNGKVWDIYSDVPGGTPPYQYTFGVDEGGVGGTEGTGYTREHSWPKSWFGGEVSPMFTDLFALYPCDAHVNGNRGLLPYGEVASPVWVSLNGSRRGSCSYPGYGGEVFEPIDEYKGDLARTYFYMATRYYTEDAAWPGSPMADGADLLPWAVDMLLEWHQADPVSQKEIERNGTIHGIQGNRNPFIDHPEFATLIYREETGVGAGEAWRLSLGNAAPNPFGPSTEIRFSLDRGWARVEVGIYDVAGRLVRALHEGPLDAGSHRVTWDGRNATGGFVANGTYFVRLVAGEGILVRKATRIR